MKYTLVEIKKKKIVEKQSMLDNWGRVNVDKK